MNASMFNALLVIVSAPVVDAPLPIRVTRAGKATLRAHNAPVRVVTRAQVVRCEYCGCDLTDDGGCGYCDTFDAGFTPSELDDDLEYGYGAQIA